MLYPSTRDLFEGLMSEEIVLLPSLSVVTAPLFSVHLLCFTTIAYIVHVFVNNRTSSSRQLARSRMVELTFSRVLRRSAAALTKQHSAARGLSQSKSYTDVRQRWQLASSKSPAGTYMHALDEGIAQAPSAAIRIPESMETTEATTLYKLESKRVKQTCVETFRHHVTHIINNGEDIDALEEGIVRLLPNVEVLHLFDNRLSHIVDLGLWAGLRSVYLQNNLIHSLGRVFSNLPFLEEVNLDNNRIGKLEGFLGCPRLTRLSMANQQTSNPLNFDSESLRALSKSLRLLNISHNRVEDLRPLASLEVLDSLEAADNNVKTLESVGVVLASCRQLKSVDLRNNPMTRTPKLRHYLRYILLHASDELYELDRKRVTHVQRAFVQGLSSALYELKNTRSAAVGIAADPYSSGSARKRCKLYSEGSEQMQKETKMLNEQVMLQPKWPYSFECTCKGMDEKAVDNN